MFHPSELETNKQKIKQLKTCCQYVVPRFKKTHLKPTWYELHRNVGISAWTTPSRQEYWWNVLKCLQKWGHKSFDSSLNTHDLIARASDTNRHENKTAFWDERCWRLRICFSHHVANNSIQLKHSFELGDRLALKLKNHEKSCNAWTIKCCPATRSSFICWHVPPVCQHRPVLCPRGIATHAIN